MRVLKEQEAVDYLERLNSCVERYCPDGKQFTVLDSVLSVELSYLKRFMRSEDSRNLAALTVTPTGFPELESVKVDLKKAYQDLENIQLKIGKSVLPLFDQLSDSKDLDKFDQSVDKIIEGYKDDQNYVDLIKKTKNSTAEFRVKSNTRDDNDLHFFISPAAPGILGYSFGETLKDYAYILGKYKEVKMYARTEGYLKYIDSVTDQPLLINYNSYIKRRGGEVKEERKYFRILGDHVGVKNFLEPLNAEVKDKILSMDFTGLPDQSFQKMIQSSSKLGAVLNLVSKENAAVSTVVKQERKRLWGII